MNLKLLSIKLLRLLFFILLCLIQNQSCAPSENAFYVECQTTQGSIDIVIEPDWSPKGAARFLELVSNEFFIKVPLFRCVKNFLCQFGYVPDPMYSEFTKRYPTIKDDPKLEKNRYFKKGWISFAGYGKNSRSFHLFITFGSNPNLGTLDHETPIGYITRNSFATISEWYTNYGDMPPWGNGPDPYQIINSGQEYLNSKFPLLDYINSCVIKPSNSNATDAL